MPSNVTNPLGTPQYPLPTEAQILIVTPEMASDWSQHRVYRRNRRVSKSVVAKYMADMQHGLWKVTRQGLIFDTEGKIIDGQHRLAAVANGEVSVAFWVYPNESRDTFEVLDQGFKRNAAQLLGVPNASIVAAGARFLATLSDQDPWTLPRFTRVTNPEIYKTVQDWPELTRYGSKVNEVRIATWIPGSAHLAVLSQAARTEHADKIDSWVRGLISGDSLHSTDPRLQLRNRFIRQHQYLQGSKNRALVYSLITKAWNAHAEEQGVQQLRWGTAERVPSVTGFDWSKINKEESAE